MSTNIIPDPNQLRPAQVLNGQLAPGATFLNAQTKFVRIAVAGARLVTVRSSFSANGTLHFYFLHPDGVTRYAAGNPSDLPITASTEAITTLTCNGEAILEIEFEAAGDGDVDFVHVYQL